MKFRPELGDLRIISAFLIGIAFGMAIMIVWREATSRQPVYAMREPVPVRERQTND